VGRVLVDLDRHLLAAESGLELIVVVDDDVEGDELLRHEAAAAAALGCGGADDDLDGQRAVGVGA